MSKVLYQSWVHRNVEFYDDLDDRQLRRYLEFKFEASKTGVTVDTLDKLVETYIHIDMTDTDVWARNENLFLSYKSIVCRHGLARLTNINEKKTFCHFLSVIRPKSLFHRFKSDLQLSQTERNQNFREFIAHAFKLSEAFQLIDNDLPTSKPAKPG